MLVHWCLEKGGNLELWPRGPRHTPITVESRFNRLALMMTHPTSWHSVSQHKSMENRCCLSNYYFSASPVGGRSYYHVTQFRGRREQPIRDVILRTDGALRMVIRKLFPSGINNTKHYYIKRGKS